MKYVPVFIDYLRELMVKTSYNIQSAWYLFDIQFHKYYIYICFWRKNIQ